MIKNIKIQKVTFLKNMTIRKIPQICSFKLDKYYLANNKYKKEILNKIKIFYDLGNIKDGKTKREKR